MDDNAKQVSSYQLDQEMLDARGISMSVEEVAALPTCRYAERVAALRLTDTDRAFLKGLRRRIKNRLASQNSRRRSMEHLRRLSRELRSVRARRDDALEERRALVAQRDYTRARCVTLRRHIADVLQSRSDQTEVPSIDLPRIIESPKELHKKVTVTETKTPLIAECFEDQKPQSVNGKIYGNTKPLNIKSQTGNTKPLTTKAIDNKIERDKSVFECCIDKIVQNSVNHIYKKDKKKIFAKTIFISNEKHNSTIKSMIIDNLGINGIIQSNEDGNVKSIDGFEENGVLNLSVKQEKRRSHGRKQSAPRRIAYACDEFYNDDGVLDLKIKKEPQ